MTTFTVEDLDTGYRTLQELLGTLLISRRAVFTEGEAGATLVVTLPGEPFLSGHVLTLAGSGLSETDGVFTGTVTGFTLVNDEGSATGEFSAPPGLAALIAAAEAGPGYVDARVTPEFYALLVPEGDALVFHGGGVANRAEGSAGDDVIDLGLGDDTYLAGPGADVADAGGGTDRLIAARLDGPWTFSFKTGVGTFDGVGSHYAGFESVSGTIHDDRLTGSSRNELLHGNHGNDVVDGKGGSDQLFGFNGRDTIVDGGGADQMSGGRGNDVFRLAAFDGAANVITDFADDRDTLDLTAFGFASVDAALALAIQAGDDVLFDFGGGSTLRLVDVVKASLAGDILV